jgi:TonB family protein
MKYLSLLISISFFLPLKAQNVQYISGNISSDTRWSGQIYIDGDIVVQKGVTLSIDSGSMIIFKAKQDKLHSGDSVDRIEFIVLGKLLAKGKPRNAKIIFTSDSGNQRIDDWYGIVIKNLNEPSILQNCTIEYAYKGITCYGSSPLIENCEIRFNYIAGISCEVRAKPIIRNNTLYANDFAGINCELASFPLIEKCTIIQNTNGIIIFDRSQPDIGHNSGRDGFSVGENRIHNNFEYSIYNHSTNDIYAQNNIWNTNSIREINQINYDQEDNSGFGKILIFPLFRSRQISSTRQIQDQQKNIPENSSTPVLSNQQVNESPSSNNAPINQDSQTQNAGSEVADSELSKGNQNSANVNDNNGQSDLPNVPDTMVAARKIVNLEPSPVEGIAAIDLNQPVIEGLLDSRKREYLRKVKPEYPQIYKITGHEGVVFMEVIVGKDGRVEKYKILKSDGEYFTEAAIAAVEQYIYRPGTFKDIPVRFKIIERFIFHLTKKDND